MGMTEEEFDEKIIDLKKLSFKTQSEVPLGVYVRYCNRKTNKYCSGGFLVEKKYNIWMLKNMGLNQCWPVNVNRHEVYYGEKRSDKRMAMDNLLGMLKKVKTLKELKKK